MAEYTPPAYNSIELNFSGSYTPPAYNAIELNFSNLDEGGSGTAIIGATTLSFTTPQPELWFPYVGTANLSFTTSARLTINIELSAETTLTFVCAPELTIGYQITGQVTEMGTPVARTLRAYDAASGALVVEGSSDPSTGEYLLDLFDHGDDVFVLCLGSATYGPLTHGPVQPDRL